MSAGQILLLGADRWLLTTPETSYLLGVVDGRLAQLHWGPRLSAADAAHIVADDSSHSDSRHDRSAFGGWSGASPAEPTLKARFDNGTRTLDLVVDSSRIGADTLVVTLRDRTHALEVDVHVKVFDDVDVIERWAVVRTTGEAVWLDRAFSATWHVPRRSNYRLSSVHGNWAAEAQLSRVALPYGRHSLESRQGISWHQGNPWLTVDAGDATETDGEVWATALEWSGNWRLIAERDHQDVVRISGGWSDFDFSYRLAENDSVMLPIYAAVYSGAGFGAASRQWHSYALGHVLSNDQDRPILYNSWEATYFDVNEDGQKKLADIAARVGCEMFVMDDGWFGARNNDQAGLGDWYVNTEKFPNGLGPLAEHLTSLGMRFGIWVEPEMVNPDSDLCRAHPDWVISFPDRERVTRRNQWMLNYARPDVREWAFAILHELVGSADISFLKWDHNRVITEPGWDAYAGVDPQRFWIEHTRGVYSVIDRLRAAHPSLEIESCAGGGGRIDFEMMRRTEQFWTSDNTDAVDRIGIQHGTSQVYPARAMYCWVTDVPNHQTGRITPLAYRCHVSMMGGLGIGANLAELNESELDELARWIAVYKDIRPIVQGGQQYRVSDPDTDDFAGVWYMAADGSRGVLITAALDSRIRDPRRFVRLPGLVGDAGYAISSLMEGTTAESTGRVLGAQGISVLLPQERSSEVTIVERRPSL